MSHEEFQRKDFLESYLQKQRELSKRQREYKNILSSKLMTRKENIIKSGFENTIEQLEEDNNVLRAKIWVAQGQPHKNCDKYYLKQIKCQIKCQEELAEDLNKLKTYITNMEREISRVNKDIYELNRQTVSDTLHQAHVAHTRKRLMILENTLEVGVRRECEFTAANSELREQLIHILNYRILFNKSYTNMVQKLNYDNKYLIDLIEYALNTFDGCIDLYEKIDNITKRESKEQETRKVEMEGIMRKLTADIDNSEFLKTKTRTRKLADLQPKEYRRREKFLRQHNRKFNLYSSVLQKLLNYTNSKDVDAVIKKFQQQESLYYSFFNYANEMSYHITLLNNSINRLFEDVVSLKRGNYNHLCEQSEQLTDLENEVHNKQATNMDLQKVRESNDVHLDNLLQGIEMLFEICNADSTPLTNLLSDNSHINLVNLKRFLKILENRVQNLTACVYVQEREDENKLSYVVEHVGKYCDMPTHLDDIVLTQQCPECAEGEVFNMDEGGDGVFLHTVEAVKHKLYEKIIQPEIQYRLHSISQCRLPRSRLLAAKRNM